MLLKNAHLRRYPAPFGGVAMSRSLFVATPPLILPRIKHGAALLERRTVGSGFKPFPQRILSASLRGATSAEAGAFLISPRK